MVSTVKEEQTMEDMTDSDALEDGFHYQNKNLSFSLQSSKSLRLSMLKISRSTNEKLGELQHSNTDQPEHH
jgi:hypothetical protein